MWILVIFALLAEPTSKPAAIDDQTWQRMLDTDRKAAAVEDLTADFEQQKFTAMLKKPLVSSGKVFVKGSAMLWDTKSPQTSVLQITADEVRMYYPAEKTIEAYKVEQKLGQLAASPLPRLESLLKYFTFEPLPLSEFNETNAGDFLALKLTPTQAELREHVEQVRVLIDTRSGLMSKLEMRDPDGDRTAITFSNAKPNTKLADRDLQINAPPETKITRPLQALER